MKQSIKTFTFALALTSAIAATASAQTTITQHTTGTASESLLFIGQSLTVPGTDGWSSLSFTFFRNGGVASAAGSLYLLTSEYLGTPAGLSAATPGFLAQSTSIVSDSYFFAPSVSILGGAQYFFYTDAEMFVSGSNADEYAGGQAYTAAPNYTGFDGDSNFELVGTSTVPEPSTYLLTLTGLAAVFGFARRRRI